MPCPECVQCHKTQQFGNLLDELLETAAKNHIPAEEVVETLFMRIKFLTAAKTSCFYHLLGALTDMLHHNLYEIWDEFHENEETDDEPQEDC